MSNRNNVVFAVLPTEGNAAVLAKDNRVEDLALGQIGFFDARTGVSFDATSTVIPKEYFIARGKGAAADYDFRKSAGQAIQHRREVGFTEKAYNAGAPMTVTIAGFKAKCDTEYGVRVEFRNSQISRIQGTPQFSKSYVVKTPCCADCGSDCDIIDSNILTQLLIQEILLDETGVLLPLPVIRVGVTADEGEGEGVFVEGISADYVAGDTISMEDLAILIAHNATATDENKVFTDLQITSVPLAVGDWCQVNLGYHKLLETVLIVSLVEGFSCSGATVSSVYPIFAEGTGANVMQKEYHASGWNGAGPYVLSETTGTAKGNIEYLAKKDVNYTQFALEYVVKSEGGWLEYENPLTTYIAIPAASTTTINSVRAMLEKVMA